MRPGEGGPRMWSGISVITTETCRLERLKNSLIILEKYQKQGLRCSEGDGHPLPRSLDPPYSSDRNQAYAVDSGDVAHDVREWAIANGDNKLYRIALCGYAGEHTMPDNWHEVAWKAVGGYGSQAAGKGRENAEKEMIWFSPRCLHSVRQRSLFDT